jgi:hypothetical protein
MAEAPRDAVRKIFICSSSIRPLIPSRRVDANWRGIQLSQQAGAANHIK